MLRLPQVPQFIRGVLAAHLTARSAALQRWAALVHEKEQDLEVGPNAKLILTDEDGKRWAVTVSPAGALVVTAAPAPMVLRASV